MDINSFKNIVTNKLEHPLFDQHQLNVQVVRYDLLDPIISGNKWFKLQEFIKEAKSSAAEGILTFGGAYSNHLIATAAAAQLYHLKSIGIVRGLHGLSVETPTIQHCKALNMELQFVERSEYNQKNEPEYLSNLHILYPNYIIIPEGGDSIKGVEGAATMYDFVPKDTTIISCAIGTGTTISGIFRNLLSNQRLIGFPALRNAAYLLPQILAVNEPFANQFSLNNDYHFGGFGKCKPELIAFINQFYKDHNIPLDFVYNGKMMFGMMELIKAGKFQNEQITILHTGGLQGNNSILSELIY